MIKKIFNRIKVACHTNDVQFGSVLFLMILCLAGLSGREGTPLWAWITIPLIWPLIAFIGNLISPIKN